MRGPSKRLKIAESGQSKMTSFLERPLINDQVHHTLSSTLRPTSLSTILRNITSDAAHRTHSSTPEPTPLSTSLMNTTKNTAHQTFSSTPDLAPSSTAVMGTTNDGQAVKEIGNTAVANEQVDPVNIPTEPQAPHAAADQLGEVETHEEPRKLMFAIDYGTKTLAVAYRIGTAADRPDLLGIRKLQQGSGYEAPQIIGYDEEGCFHFGEELEELIDEGEVLLEDTIELFKLYLYEEHRDSPMVSRVRSWLKSLPSDYTMAQVIGDHLRAVIALAKEQIKGPQRTLDIASDDIDKLPMVLYLSVPQWKPPGNKIMTDAAAFAGIPIVELVYEPQCAAAYFTHSVRDRLPAQVSLGEVAVVVDGGAGTVDLASYEWQSKSDQGAKVHVAHVGRAKGALCGLEHINQAFLHWLENGNGCKTGSFKGPMSALCKHLGLSREAFLRRANRQFEDKKIHWKPPKGKSAGTNSTIIFEAAQDSTASDYIFKIPGKQMQSFHDPLVKKIMALIDEQDLMCGHRIRFMILPGGFGRSPYLRNRLKAKYNPESLAPNRKRIEIRDPGSSGFDSTAQPVACGALLRYSDIENGGIPAKASFGIGQVEEWVAKLHPDATDRKKRTERPNPLVTEKDPITGNLVVHDRWVPAIQIHDEKRPGVMSRCQLWMMQYYYVDECNPALFIQPYWTEKVMKRHDPTKDAHNTLHTGIYKWGEESIVRLPNLLALGFEAKEVEPLVDDCDSENEEAPETQDRDVFEVWFRLVIEWNGANVNMRVQLAKPGTEPYKDGEYTGDEPVELADDQFFSLSSSSHNPFPRTNPG